MEKNYKEYKTEWFKPMPYDYIKIENHLTEMAAKGWILDEIGVFGWKYKKCEPVKLKFSVIFNSSTDYVSAKGAGALESYYSSIGWNELITWQKMHIYYTYNPEAVPIEKDEVSRLDNTWTAIRMGYIPQAVMLLLLQILVLFRNIKTYLGDGTMPEIDEILLICILGCAVAAPVTMLLGYRKWYRKFRSDIGQGGTCRDMKRIDFLGKLWLTAAAILLAVWTVVTMSIHTAIGVVLLLILIPVLHKPVKANVIKGVRRGNK